jgi:hypothetical protein
MVAGLSKFSLKVWAPRLEAASGSWKSLAWNWPTLALRNRMLAAPSFSTTSAPCWRIACCTAAKLVSGPPIRRRVSAPSVKFWMTLSPSPWATMKVVPEPPLPTKTSSPAPP